MEVTGLVVKDSEVEVTVVHTIRVGGKYRLNPSLAFAGIESGAVEILFLGAIDEYQGVEKNTLLNQVEELTENLTSEEANHIRNDIWVGYSTSSLAGDTWVDFFPMKLFIEHVSIR